MCLSLLVRKSRSSHGKTFVIHDTHVFMKEVAPLYFPNQTKCESAQYAFI